MITNTTKKKDTGSVLVVAMVIVAIGTLGVLASVSVIGARSLQSEAELDGVERRAKFSNSKALARELIYRNHLHGDTVLAAQKSVELPGGWGKAVLDEFDTPALSYDEGVRIHPTGAAPLRAFSNDVDVKLSDGGFDHDLQCQLRSYNPVLAGDLVAVHPTLQSAAETVRISGDLRVEGRAVFWGANYQATPKSTIRAREVIVPFSGAPSLVLEDPDNNPIKPDNYISYSQTVGQTGAGNHYVGHLNIVNNSASGVNSYFQKLSALGGHATANGAVGSTDGFGPTTAPPLPTDAALIAMIDDQSIDDSTLVGNLASSSPLSSNVINHVLVRNPPVSESLLMPLMNAHAPLPDDVIVTLGNPATSISQTAREELLNNTGYSYISDGQGTVTVDLKSPYLPNLLLTDVTEVILKGQNDSAEIDLAKAQDPRVIAIENADNVYLRKVDLAGATNQRRIVFALAQTGVLDGADLVDSHGTPDTSGSNFTRFVFTGGTPFVQWRMIAELQGVSSYWDVAGTSSGTLVGGIRTDHSIRINGGALKIERETEVAILETLLSRNAWVEIYK